VPDTVKKICTLLTVEAGGFKFGVHVHLLVVLPECHPIASFSGVVENCSFGEDPQASPCPLFREPVQFAYPCISPKPQVMF
jgi:hypothetical protein